MSSWIKIIDEIDADEDLNLALNQAKTPHGTVDNVLRVHSLRPSTMVGHMKLYKSVLHDEKNTCLLYTSPSPRDRQKSRMPSSA